MLDLERNIGALRDGLPVLRQRAEPASPEAAVTALELLLTRYAAMPLDEATEAALKLEWLDDLSPFPLDLIREACRIWRNSDTGFPPRSAGQLMAPVVAEMRKRRADLWKVERFLEVRRDVPEPDAIPLGKYSEDIRDLIATAPIGQPMPTRAEPRMSRDAMKAALAESRS